MSCEPGSLLQLSLFVPKSPPRCFVWEEGWRVITWQEGAVLLAVPGLRVGDQGESFRRLHFSVIYLWSWLLMWLCGRSPDIFLPLTPNASSLDLPVFLRSVETFKKAVLS